MREIKFRAWDKASKRMILPEYSDWEDFMIEPDGTVSSSYESGGYSPYRSKSRVDYEIMQYTGLKDKNGKEIYEGDLIKFDDTNIGFIDCEEWTEFFIHWISEPDCTDYARDFYRISRAEVIGNIHENPELL